jgi:polyisoprenoid-binding protein YceI
MSIIYSYIVYQLNCLFFYQILPHDGSTIFSVHSLKQGGHMKSLIAIALSLSTVLAVAQDKPMAETFKVDAASSKVAWVGKKVTGQHSGNISVKSGSITFNGDLIIAGEIVGDMKTITVTDIPVDSKENKETNAKLVGHLSSPDFFDVAKNPESKFVITSSEKNAKGLLIKGNFTMIGKTKPLEFIATVTKGAEVKIKGDVVIDRTKWDLKYGSGSFFKGLGDKAINNEFTLSLDLTAKK